jgi:hypothetical protein
MPGPLNRSGPERLTPSMSLVCIPGALYVATLAGALVLDATYPGICKLDPGGAHRDVTLEAEATSVGLYRRIINAADAAENLVVKDDGAATIGTVNQNEQGEFYCDGTAWILICITAIALS